MDHTLLTFAVGRTPFAVPASDVVEALPVPAGAGGVMMHDGAMVPVVDLQALLSLPGDAYASSTAAIVLKSSDGPFAILVHQLGGVRTVPAEIVADRAIVSRFLPSCVRALVRSAHVLHLLDVRVLAGIAHATDAEDETRRAA